MKNSTAYLLLFFSAHSLFSCHISSFVNLFIPRAFICFHIYQSLHIPLLLMHLKQLFASLCIRLPRFGLLFLFFFLASLPEFQIPPIPNHLSMLCLGLSVRQIVAWISTCSVIHLFIYHTSSPVLADSSVWTRYTHAHTCWLRSKPVGCGAGRGWCWGAVRGTNGLGTMKTYQ